MFILAFSGFLRRSELCVILSRDVQFNEGYVKISIEKSKTDTTEGGLIGRYREILAYRVSAFFT